MLVICETRLGLGSTKLITIIFNNQTPFFKGCIKPLPKVLRLIIMAVISSVRIWDHQLV